MTSRPREVDPWHPPREGSLGFRRGGKQLGFGSFAPPESDEGNPLFIRFRQEFLWAIERVAPNVLTALRVEVKPVFDRWYEHAATPDECWQAMQDWSRQFRIDLPWVHAVASLTILEWQAIERCVELGRPVYVDWGHSLQEVISQGLSDHPTLAELHPSLPKPKGRAEFVNACALALALEPGMPGGWHTYCTDCCTYFVVKSQGKEINHWPMCYASSRRRPRRVRRHGFTRNGVNRPSSR